MHRNSPQLIPALRLLAALVIGSFAAAPCITQAAVLTWDANGSTSGPQDGSGTWTTGSGGWWNGTSGTTWIGGFADQAVFGAGTPGTYTISLGSNVSTGNGTSTTGGLNFLTSGYTLSATTARTVTVGQNNAASFVRVASGQTATIGANVTVTKNTGNGLALLGGGTLRVDAGGVFQNPFANASEVANGSTLWLNGGSVSYASSIAFGQLTAGYGTSGSLMLDSGTFSVSAGNFIVSRATGDVSTATVNGGAVTIAAGGLNFGSAGITGTSTFNLNGGSVTVRQLNYFGGTATFNFNGGTLKAQTSGSSAFMTGLTRANVRNGGAVFDSNGQSITVAQALLHSTIGGDDALDGGLTLNDTAGTKGTLTLTGANTYTGTTSVRAGTLAYGANNVIAAGDVSVDGSAAVLSIGGFSDTVGAVAVKNGGAITGSTGVLTGTAYLLESGSVGAILDGSGSLTKTTSGTVTLSGANTLNGATTVSAGTLRVAGAGSLNNSVVTVNGAAAAFRADSSAHSAPITLTQGTVTGSGTVGAIAVGDNSGAIISNNGGVAGAAFTTGTLTFDGAANLNLFVSTTMPALVTGGLVTNAAGVVSVNPSAASWDNGVTYNLLTYAGGSVGGAGFGQFSLGTVSGKTVRQTPSFADTGSAFTLSFAGDTPYWVGDGNREWNTTSPDNWKLIAANTYTDFLSDDEVIFDDRVSGTGTAAVQINAADVATFSTRFDNSTRDYEVTGPFGISAGTFMKTGAGTVTLATPNSYTGATSINAGTLVLSGSLGSTPITVAAGANFTQGAAGRIGGAASLTTSGAVSLGGVNTYSGTTTVTSGTLTATAANALSPNSPVALSGGRLNLGGASQASGAVLITDAAASGDTIANGSLTAMSYATSHTTGHAVISANLLASGSAGFTMTGGGTTTLSGANTYTGPTTVSAGVLRAGSSDAFTSKGILTLSNAAGFDLNGSNASFTGFSGSATNTVTTGGTGAGTDTLTITNMAATGVLFADGAERLLALALSGTPTNDPLTNGSNTFSGGLSLLNMRLSVENNSATTGGRYGKGTITIGTGAQMYFNVANKTVSNNVVVNANSVVGSRTGAFRVDTAGQVLSGTITAAAADAMFNVGGGVGVMTLTGKVTGSSGLQVRNAASNGTSMTLVLNTPTDANDYQGQTAIGDNSTVTLRLAAANQIPNGVGKGNVSVTGVLDLAGFDETINSLSGAGTIDNASAGTSNVLTIGDGNLTNTFSGVIKNTNGVLGLTKIGSGTQTLSGTSTYTGKTSVNAGTLAFRSGADSATAAQSLGAHADVDLGVAGTSSGRLRYTGTAAGTLAKNVNALGNSQNVIENAGTGLLTLSGTLTKNGTILTLAGGTSGIDVTGPIVGASVNSDLSVDGGTTTLSTENSYNGPTSIFNGATLNANAADALPTQLGRTAIILDQTGSGSSTLSLGVSQAIASLTGIASSAVNLGGNALTVGTSSGTTTFAGLISGIGGSLVKDGLSTLVLSGSNTYTGPTTVSAGGLSVNGLLGGGVSVAEGAVLSGTGTIAGAVSVLGTLSPGNSPGLLTVGSLVLGGTSTTNIEITGLTRGVDYDAITVTDSNSLTYGGSLLLAFGAATQLADNSTLDIFAFTGSTTGAFSSVTSTGYYAGTWTDVGGGTFQLQKDSQTLTFSQASGDIIVVPEPSTLALVGLGGLLAAVARRRR